MTPFENSPLKPASTDAAPRDSTDRFNAIINGSGDGLWDWKVSDDRLWTTGRFRELLDLPENDDAPPLTIYQLVRRIHPRDLRRTIDAFNRHLATSCQLDFECRLRTVLAGFRWFRVQGAAQRDAAWNPVRVAGSLVDIHDYKVAEARETARARTLALIAGGTPLPAILETIVRGIEAENPKMLCSILLLDKTGNRLINGSAPSLPAFYNEAINGILTGPDVGSCGTAAWSGKRVVCQNLQTDPKWAKFKELAARAGLGACWSDPIVGSDGRVLGTFAMYKRRPHSFNSDDLSIITPARQFASIAIEHKSAEDALRWRTAFFEAQADSSADGLLVIDSEGRKVHQNKACVSLWKIPQEYADDIDDARQLNFVISRVKNPQKFAERVQYLYHHPLETSQDEIELVDGTILERFSSPVVGKGGEYYGRIWRFRDITQSKAMEEQLRAAALRDGLTNLPNRAMLLDRLQYAIERHKRFNEMNFAVLFIDFDRFKMVNDNFGHLVGDQLLREISSRLQHAVRAVDLIGRAGCDHTVSRLGGDEFVILLDLLQKPGDALVVAQRILDALSNPFSLAGQEIVSTASIGIVTSEFNYERAEDILRDADTAMYEAKNAGRARAAVFDETMRTRIQRRLELENGLRKALDAEQFLLHFQPIVSLRTGRIEGIEALLRWQHPSLGMIAPAEFIPIAEETHLIVPLGEWTFREACAQLAAWQKNRGPGAIPSISVNLSRLQLSVPDLAQRLFNIAYAAGVHPAAVHLEITESTVMTDADLTSPALRKIKAMGFKIDMDDFGTGFSSLASLQLLPIDVLKIDRSFVANMSRGQSFKDMVGAIITLANNLKIPVIAEGVETGDQADTLQSLGCPLAQGYLYARPMTADQVDEFLTARQTSPPRRLGAA